MLARYARGLLLFELLAIAALALGLFAWGAGAPAAIAIAIALSLAVRAAMVLNSFVLACALAPAGAAPLAPGAKLRLLAAEFASTVAAYSLLLPFPGLAGPADPVSPRSDRALPVLLVHGYICNGAIWRAMKRFLAARGIAAWTIDLEPVTGSIDGYAEAIARRIEDILAASGARQVVVVAHSMGGLAMRAYLRSAGGARVARLVTLGSPHHGTRIASLGIGENVHQMLPGSPWLADLARSESAGQKAPVTSIWSRHDNIIAPQESARLEGASDAPVDACGHVRLVFDAGVRKRVLAEILAASRR